MVDSRNTAPEGCFCPERSLSGGSGACGSSFRSERSCFYDLCVREVAPGGIAQGSFDSGKTRPEREIGDRRYRSLPDELRSKRKDVDRMGSEGHQKGPSAAIGYYPEGKRDRKGFLATETSSMESHGRALLAAIRRRLFRGDDQRCDPEETMVRPWQRPTGNGGPEGFMTLRLSKDLSAGEGPLSGCNDATSEGRELVQRDNHRRHV